MLQRRQSGDELMASLRAGLADFPGAKDAAYREALHAWADALWRVLAPHGPALSLLKEIKRNLGGTEMTTIGEANMRRYREKLLQQGVEQGMEQGLEQGLEQGRADAFERLRREAASSLDPATAERVSKLIDGLH